MLSNSYPNFLQLPCFRYADLFVSLYVSLDMVLASFPYFLPCKTKYVTGDHASPYCLTSELCSSSVLIFEWSSFIVCAFLPACS